MSTRLKDVQHLYPRREVDIDGLVHDLSNLLQMAKGHLDLALLKRDETAKRLKIARLAVTRAASLAELARRRDDSREFCLLFEIPGIISEAVDAALASDSVQAAFDFSDIADAPGHYGVWLSRLGLYRVVQNIAWNSSQVLQNGGDFLVSARIEPTTGTLVLTFDDNGPGTDSSNLKHILERGFSLRSGGDGLGLAIVRDCVEDWGGRISPSNRPEGGMRMEIRLPLRAGADSARIGEE